MYTIFPFYLTVQLPQAKQTRMTLLRQTINTTEETEAEAQEVETVQQQNVEQHSLSYPE